MRKRSSTEKCMPKICANISPAMLFSHLKSYRKRIWENVFANVAKVDANYVR